MSDQRFGHASKSMVYHRQASERHTTCRECGKHVVVTFPANYEPTYHLEFGKYVDDYDGYGICDRCAQFTARLTQRAE